MFLNRETGELTFSDGLRLGANTSTEALSADRGDAQVFLPAREADGATLCPLCELRDGTVCAVTLYPLAQGAARQRAALFAALGLTDPCPDTRLCVRAGCPFGEVLVATEPYFSQSYARVEYRARDDQQQTVHEKG